MTIMFAMPGNEHLACDLAARTCAEPGEMIVRRFPDGESYVRVLADVKDQDVWIVCTLAWPDAHFLPLAFAADTLRSLGARRVGLIAPYVAYMRQDRVFHPGEALTSLQFARLLDQHFDQLMTVDPHLHRHASLAEIFSIPTIIVHAAPLLAEWIAANVEKPVIIGPDAESAHWVSEIASEAGAPWTVFAKERRGDRKVRMFASGLERFRGLQPVIVDDIVSSGITVRKALKILAAHDFDPAYCLAVHALCSARTARRLSDMTLGFKTANTVPNGAAAFDIAPVIAEALIAAAAGMSAVQAA